MDAFLRGVLFLFVLTWRPAISQTNLLVNPSFESDLKGNWKGGVTRILSNDARQGNYVVKSAGRISENSGPYIDNLPIQTSARYALNGWVKLTDASQSTKIWQTFKAALIFTYPNGTTGTWLIARRGFATAAKGWINLKGDIMTPQIESDSVRLCIRGPDAGVDFIADDFSLYEVAENTNWRQDSFARIETYRKTDMTFNVNLPAGVSASDIDIQIDLKKHQFAFGSLVTDQRVMASTTSPYSQLFFNLFNWAVVQSYKWKFDRGTPTNPDFSRALTTTNLLRANGVTVRGHNIFWDVEKNVPDWVRALPVSQVPAELNKHLDYMVNISLGKLVQLDVQNEHIYSHYYEERLGAAYKNLTKDFFRRVKAKDDATKLYFNDFTAVTSGAHTEELHDLMLEYLSEGVPVDGMGIQGHTKEFTRPDPTMMWRRLDRLAEVGLEMTMTEFDVGWPDVVQRADWLEDAFRAFYAHPKLRGVVMWGFLDVDMPDNPDHELLSGEELTFLETGERFACLVKKEWSTHETRNLGASGLTFGLRGFQGDYEVIVKRSGVPVQKSTFSLGTTSKIVNLQVTSSTAAIAVVQERDYVPECISHRDETSVGVQASTSTNAQLSCTIRSSPVTGLGENEEGTATCASDEVLTSCSAFDMGTTPARNGDKMVMENGVAVCKVYNGRNSTAGVKAYALCCKRAGLTCDYRTAGPSAPFDGAKAEATCPTGTTPLGCSSYTRYADFDGGYPNLTRTGCLAQSGAPAFPNPQERSGVRAYAACCSAPGLNCQVVQSAPTGLSAGSSTYASCPVGFVMTGCTAYSDRGKAAGAKIFDDANEYKCRASLGADLPAGSTGVIAFATCCQA